MQGQPRVEAGARARYLSFRKRLLHYLAGPVRSGPAFLFRQRRRPAA